MLKQISLFNVVVGLLFISVPATAEQTTVVQSQQVVTETGKAPAVQQITSTSSTVPPTNPSSTTTLTADQLMKVLNSTIQTPTTMQIPSSVIITLPPAAK
jgi:hypothetical protein